MSRIAVMLAVWKRPAVTAAVLSHLARLKSFFDANPGPGLLTVVVRSPEDKVWAEADLEEDYGVDVVVDAPNVPLGAKLNAGMEACEDLGVDGVIGIGADDFIDKHLIRAWAEGLAYGYDLQGVRDIYLFDWICEQVWHWRGYQSVRRRGESVGAGRCFSSRILEALNWRPWVSTAARGIDRTFVEKLQHVGRYKTRTLSMADIGTVLVDVKDAEGLNRIEGILYGDENNVVEIVRGGDVGGAWEWLRKATTGAFTSDLSTIPRPRIAGLCIAKGDEGEQLFEALHTARPVVDNLFVRVDKRGRTGGVEAARAAMAVGAGVHIQEPVMWGEDIDFAATRNALQERVPEGEYDWALIIDADDKFEYPDRLRRDIYRAHYDDCVALECLTKCWRKGKLAATKSHVRAYRMGVGIKWEFPRHNRLTGFPEESSAWWSQAVVHTDYPDTLDEKVDRIVPALELMLDRADPGSRWEAHACYYLLQAHTAIGNWEEAVAWSDRCRELWNGDGPEGEGEGEGEGQAYLRAPECAAFWVWGAWARLHTERLGDMEVWCNDAVEAVPGFSDVRLTRVCADLIRMVEGVDRMDFRQTQSAIRKIMPNVGEVCRLLGLPVNVQGAESAQTGAGA